MKNRFKKFTPLGKLFVTFGAPALPLAMVISCGETSAESINFDSYDSVVKFLQANLSANLNFTNDGVGWRSNVKNDAQIAYRYLSGNYPTLKEVKAADPAAWLVTPPSVVAPLHNERYLWVEAVSTSPTLGITGDKRFIDLTVSSNVQNIKTQVDMIPEYNTIDFANAELIGSYSYPEVSLENVKIPVGVALVYRTAKTDWMTREVFINYLKNNGSGAAEFASVSVRTQSSDLTKFIVRTPREGAVRNSLVARPNFDLAFVNALESIKPDLTSSNDKAVVWSALTEVDAAKSSNISKIEYYAGVQSKTESLNDVLTSEWKAALPSALDEVHKNRNLWVKITPAGVSNTNPVTYYNLTFSSGVRKVKTDVTFLEGFLSGTEVAGRRGAVSINKLPVLKPGAVAVFQIADKTPFMSQNELITYLNTNAAVLTIKDYFDIYVKLVLIADSSLYSLQNDHLTGLRNAMSFTGGTPFELIATLDAIRIQGDTPASIPTNTNMRWITPALSIPSTVESIKYYIGTINNLADVSDLSEDKWFTTLPTSLPFSARTLSLWARVKFKVANSFPEYFDLTASSEFYVTNYIISSDPKYNNPAAWEHIPHQIKTVTKQTASENFDFKLYLDEDPEGEIFRSAYPFLKAFYSYNNGAWVSKENVIAQIKADPTKQLRIWLANPLPNRFVVDNNWVIDANITNWSQYI